MYSILDDRFFMTEALKEAKFAMEADEVPVGAVIVLDGRIIARGHNQTERLTDVTAHAEMLCLTAASEYLGAKYLDSCTLYVTLEPCVMCAGAMQWAQLGRLVYGASDEKRGYTCYHSNILHPSTSISQGVMGAECGALLTDFFRKKRY
ncbi:MAG: nucleoside deaminase [Lentimicrobiaceae bacterium]|nr:nucleoside deaminase [Lentimicrobiaceae bacterium]